METVVIMDSSSARVVVRQILEAVDAEQEVERICELEGLSFGNCEWMSGVRSIDIQYV